MNGALDGFILVGDGATISGWACRMEDGERLPVPVDIVGARFDGAETFRRADIGTAHAFGIRFTLPSHADLLALATGTARCVAHYRGRTYDIPVWDKLKGKVLAALLVRAAETLDAAERAGLMAALLEPARSVPGLPGAETARLSIEVGFRSHDDAVVVGRDGHLFLEGGTNSLSRMYEEPADEARVAAWADLVERRRAQAERAGARFVQVIVPEKQSVLGHLHPAGDRGCTPLLQGIAARLSGKAYYLDALSAFRGLVEEGRDPYRAVDTHLSFHGYQCLAGELGERITGEPMALATPELASSPAAGDLGSKIGWGNVVETSLSPVERGWALAGRDVRLDRSSDPETGHIGYLRQWTCDDAESDRSVLVFGNSMFERGAGPLTLSWWFARMFRRMTFLWSPTVDPELIERLSPDMVVCQTVERFLKSVPTQ